MQKKAKKMANRKDVFYYLMKDMLNEEFIRPGATPPQQSPTERTLAAAREPIKQYILKVEADMDWSDVIGNDEAKQALLDAIEFPFTHQRLYEHYGLVPPKGVLLWGPPGCGKTMFAKAAASAVAKLYGKAAELLYISGPSIQSPYVGRTEETIRNIFAYARAYSNHHSHPLVIFIDEADSLFPRRDSGYRYEASQVAQLLAEMDGLRSNGAFTILASNRPETIDEALLRDGRCDHKIKVERPGLAEAREILLRQLDTAPKSITSSEVDSLLDYLVSPSQIVSYITAITLSGKQMSIPITLANILNGAMLVGLVARAKAFAFRRDLSASSMTGISYEDLEKAVDEVVKENEGLPHTFAVREIEEKLNAEARVQHKRSLN